VVLGPQDRFFTREAIAALVGAPYRLTDAYDRMGVRLRGPQLVPEGALSIPSEPILRGSIQVAGDGVPAVLLADHQTTGGYPKIATIVSAHLDGFVQLRPHEVVRFHAVTPEEAVGLARLRAGRRQPFDR
jgi:allophanate hydrolase